MDWLIFLILIVILPPGFYFFHLHRMRKVGEQVSILSSENSLLKNDLKKRELENGEKEERLAFLNEHRVRLETERKFLEERINEQKTEILKIRQEMSGEFRLIAGKILDENSEKFSRTHRDNLKNILDPFREKIREFEEQVKDTREKNVQDNSALREQIRLLNEVNRQLGDEARNLTRALKGDQKVQGNWGEVILKRVLELSGLEEGREYVLQGKGMKLKSEEGEHQLPDVVVHLPEKKHLIIDAKVSLVAYERLINEETDDRREEYLKEHLISFKNHIKGLGQRYYQGSSRLDAPDFVLLFVPIEASFGMALRADGELFDFAWKRKIVIVSPSTLLATLKTICSVWKYEYRQANAIEIAKLGGSIYNQIAGFLEEMKKVDSSLDQSKKAYDAAMKKLSTGNQSIIKKAKKLRDLGVETNNHIE